MYLKMGLFMRFTYFPVMLIALYSLTSGQESLRKHADAIGLNIGVAMGSQFDMGNATHNNLVKAEFNTVVAENSMKAQNIHPSKGRTNFGGPDKLLSFAQQNNMKMRGHTLIWHSQNAGWITTGSRQQVLENMKYHIETVMGHFKGKIFQWDVVNEAFEDGGPNLRNSAYKSIVGEDFIDSAFVFAHRVDPDCKLFYNDFSTSTINSKSTAIYNKVKKMLQNKIPIDGVGFQSHQSTGDGSSALYDKVKENFERFAALGLEIAITELDVKGSDFTAQAKVYSTYLQIALEMPAVKTYMIWGVRDQDSWVSPTPLIFNNSFQPKPAYTAILNLLKDPPPAVSVFQTNHRVVSSANPVLFSYNNTEKTIMISDQSTSGRCPIELFNIAGAKIFSCIVPTNVPFSLSSIAIPSGTTLVKANDQVLRVNLVR